MRFYAKTQYIVLYIISLFLIGVTSLIDKESGINIAALKQLPWYIDQALTSFAIITTIMATVTMIIDQFKANNPEYKKLDDDIKQFADHEYIPTLFSKFMLYINPKRKQLQHEHNVKKSLFLLDKRVKDKDLEIWNNGTELEKSKNRYCKKRKRLEERLDKLWIEKNLSNLGIRYDKVTSGLVLGGYYSKEDNESPNEFITKHTESKILRDKLPVLMLGIAVSSLASSIVVQLLFNGAAIVSIATKLFVLLWQLYNSIKYANDWTIQITLKDIRFRKAITQEYKLWLKQQASQNQEV